MVCPFGEDCVTSVIDSRKNSEGIRRRRECSTCGLRFTTYEKADISLMVEKRSGDIEEFSYEKLYQGIDNAFGGIDISDKKLKTLVDNVHKDINEVAYLRFASVYKEFSAVSDFEKEAAELN